MKPIIVSNDMDAHGLSTLSVKILQTAPRDATVGVGLTPPILQSHAFKPEKQIHQPKMEKRPVKEKDKMPAKKDMKNDLFIPRDVMDNKASEIGRFWSVEKPLKAESKKLLHELLPFFGDVNMERLIVPRSIKSLGVYKNYNLSDTMKAEVNGISLRAIEWLVTNYSKGTKIVLFNEKDKKRIDIHNAYEIQSNYYKRNLFDPFCRHGRVYFLWKLQSVKSSEWEEVVMITTVGQLNFMKWADENGILDYARTHKDEIQQTMESTLSEVNKEKKLYKKMGKPRKRKELTKEPEIYCTVYSLDTHLYFDHMDDGWMEETKPYDDGDDDDLSCIPSVAKRARTDSKDESGGKPTHILQDTSLIT